MSPTSGIGFSSPVAAGAAWRSVPGPFSSPSVCGSSNAAVSGLIRISPASDAASISTTRVDAGPVTRSSRCEPPTRKNWKRPEWRPACIFSVTDPAEVRGRPIARSVRRISNAALAARAVWSSPSYRSSSASPPNLSKPPPRPYATSSRAEKVAFMTSVTSSAPARPEFDSRSDIAVKPEMSMNASVPSCSTQRSSGLFCSHSTVSRGTNGTSSAAAVTAEADLVDVTGGLCHAARRGL